MFTILFSKGVFVFCVLVVIVLILLAYAIKTANALKAAENKVRELDSDVDIALAKRYDLLTKQYAMVKTYMSYESENLITAIKLRKGMTPDEKTGSVDWLSGFTCPASGLTIWAVLTRAVGSA